MHHRQQLQAVKLSYLAALQRLRLPLAEQTAQRFGEVGQILKAMHLLEADTLNGLVTSVEDMAGSELLIPQISSPQLAANYQLISDRLKLLAGERAAAHYVTADHPAAATDATQEVALVAPRTPAPVSPAQDLDYPPEPTPQPRYNASEQAKPVTASVASRSATQHHAAPRDAAWYDDARARMDRKVWSIDHLVQILDGPKDTLVRNLVREWETAGLVVPKQRGFYSFTESEGANAS